MSLSYDGLTAYIQGLYDDDGQLSAEDYSKIILYVLANGDLSSSARDLIQIRRGNYADLPNLAQGELGFTMDNEKLFIGGLNGNVELLKKYIYNVKDYGAIGDGLTDDSESIQSAIDDCYNNGGGTIFFPNGEYRIETPLLMKSVASTGGYDYGIIEFKGESLRNSSIVKYGTNTIYDLDASVIMIRGSSLDLDDSFSSMLFTNIKIVNNSTNSTTYGVYGYRGSRVIASYSSFETYRESANVDSHNRYAFYQYSGWAWSFRDCSFYGDYGFYNAANSTSLLLENTFANCIKNAYHVVGTYCVINNAFGDFNTGIVFNFNFCNVYCTSLACESPDADTIIYCNNSNVYIGKMTVVQPTSDTGEISFLSGSTLKVGRLLVEMEDTNKGYLCNGGTQSNFIVDELSMNNEGRFLYDNFDDMATNVFSIDVKPLSKLNGTVNLINKNTTGYWDWYMATPRFPINNIILGMNDRNIGSDETDYQWKSLGVLNGIYFNNNVSDRNVLGWVRYSQTSDTLRDGENYYIPLILSGDTSSRPTWQTIGMQYFDTDLNKPIWWNGSAWVDSDGNTV